jgi:endonuclease/exonuclease/phosphatase family metal-dependent hydrolase
MRIITFNILADHLIDFTDLQRDYPTIDAKSLAFDKRIATTCKYLSESKADIIFLQECTIPSTKYLAEYLTDYLVSPLAKHDQSKWHGAKTKAYGNTTLLLRSSFTNVKFTTEHLHKSGAAYGITYCTDITSKQPMILVNMHLDSESEKLRQSENSSVLKFLSKFYKTHSIIVAGDYNTNSTTLHSTYKDFVSGITTQENKNQGTFLCEKPMIDYIYLYGFDKKSITSFIDNKPMKDIKNCFLSTILTYGSDHYPVIVNANLA